MSQPANPAVTAKMALPTHNAHDPVHENIRYSPEDAQPIQQGNTNPSAPHAHGHGFPHSLDALGEELVEDQHVQHRPVRFGPGFRAATVEHPVQYILVTPEMMQQMAAGHAAVSSGTSPTVTPKHSSVPFNKGGDTSEHWENQNDLPVPPQDEDEVPFHIAANPLARIRSQYKEYLGEFIGTMVLIIFGNGVNCQAVLTDFTQGQYLSISFGWGIGVMFGVYVCGGVSGAHINPAVSITLAIFRGFPWRKVPGYALAQILGACVGSCLIQGNYQRLLNQYEGGYNLRTYGLKTSTAALFFTDTKPYMTNVSAFFSEVLASAVLLGLILCLSDQNNNPAPAGMNGMILLWLIVGIGAALGTETAYCLNPARDLGPRIACAMFGYPSKIWTYRHCYWIYVPIVATIFGGIIGGFVYDLFIFDGQESPLNKPWGKPWGKKKNKSGNGRIANV